MSGELLQRIPTLQTPRLILRPFELTDAPEVQRLAGDRAIADTTLNIPHPYEDGVAEQWISTHQNAFAQDKEATFAICRRADAVLIGAISLLGIVKGHQAELGYWIGKPYWRQGFCTEAAQAVLDLAFRRLGLIRIHARHMGRNPASGRVLEKLGMLREGCRRCHVRKWDQFEDLNLYGILSADWYLRNSPAPRS